MHLSVHRLLDPYHSHLRRSPADGRLAVSVKSLNLMAQRYYKALNAGSIAIPGLIKIADSSLKRIQAPRLSRDSSLMVFG